MPTFIPAKQECLSQFAVRNIFFFCEIQTSQKYAKRERTDFLAIIDLVPTRCYERDVTIGQLVIIFDESILAKFKKNFTHLSSNVR